MEAEKIEERILKWEETNRTSAICVQGLHINKNYEPPFTGTKELINNVLDYFKVPEKYRFRKGLIRIEVEPDKTVSKGY